MPVESNKFGGEDTYARPGAEKAVNETGRSVEIDDGESSGVPGDKAIQAAGKNKLIESRRHGALAKEIFFEHISQQVAPLFEFAPKISNTFHHPTFPTTRNAPGHHY